VSTIAAAVNELNWFYIGVAALLPPAGAFLVALPFWLKAQPIFGNLAGTAIIFGAAFVLIMREHVELDRGIMSCFEQGMVCFPQPPAFTRYAIYGFIALAEVIVLFMVSLRVEHRLRRRGYDPQWR
jgi:hypothetical protein